MDTIPEDVWPLIVKFMDDKTKRWMRLANTKWFNIIRYDDFKLYFTRSNNIGAISDRLSKYSWPVKVRFNKTKLNDPLDLINNLSKMKNIVEISSDDFINLDFDQITDEHWMQLSTLTNLKLWGIESANGYIPYKLWQKFTKLTEYDSAKFNEDEIKSLVNSMVDLQSFIFYADSDTWPYALLSNPNRLTKLHMSAQIPFEHGEEFLPHLTNVKDFSFYDDTPNNHDMNLAYLTALESIFMYGEVPPSFGTSNTNLTYLHFNCKLTRKNTEQFSNLTNLRTLTIYVHSNQAEPIEFNFLSHLRHLRHFKINDSPDPYGKTIEKSTLENLLPSLTAFESANAEIDLAQLTHLTNLEHLYLFNSYYKLECIDLFSNLTYLHFTPLGECRSIEKLTKLEDLSLDINYNGNNVEITEDELPNLSKLFSIKQLRWSLNGFPKTISDQIKYLTALTHLHIAPNGGDDEKIAIDNCDFLQDLTNLVEFSVAVKIENDRSLWRNLSKLTKLEYLTLHYVSEDESLLLLTALTHLTGITIQRSSKGFNGRYFTALTSLQEIHFHGHESQLVHKKAELMNKMPYLLTYSYFIPLK